MFQHIVIHTSDACLERKLPTIELKLASMASESTAALDPEIKRIDF